MFINLEMSKNKILEIQNLSKSFPGVKALDNVFLNVYKGKTMGLIGENGAGKSTIINIIGGIHKRDEGKINFDGKEIWLNKIQDSKKIGISIVHQEIQLVDNLTILENLFLGNEMKNKFGLYDWNKMDSISKEALKKLDIQHPTKTTVKNLSIGEKQIIEIAKALILKSKLIIFDEPTSSLSMVETKKLFEIIFSLKKDGISSIYVSHRMEEINKVCDDVTIFRDGKSIVEKNIKMVSEEKIIEYMIGRKLKDQYSNIDFKRGDLTLEAKKISNNFVKNISFKAYEGEVLGFFGLVGAGRTELFKSLIGIHNYNGDLKYLNSPIKFKSPSQAIKKGFYYLTEDRKNEGLILDFSIKNNTSISSLQSLYINKKIPIISIGKEFEVTKKLNNRLKTKMNSVSDICKNLSGGNQQRVVLARSLMTIPKLLVLDEPTRGIDVGAKKEIYELIQKLKTYNTCLIVISSDIQEILGISDRVVVMADGSLVSTYSNKDATSSKIMNDIVSKKRKR